jgi:long-chain fatty acid transport protein
MNLHRRVALVAACVAAVLTPCLALGAGYGIYEQGASTLGMAGAATASVHDASANFFNPAAIVRLEGKQMSLGTSWLSTRTSFAGVEPYPGFGVTEEMKTGNFFPFNAYWTNHLNKDFAYGVGVNTPFGLGVEWKNPLEFTGRERVTKASVQTINANLNLAWAANDQFSVAVGYDALFAGVDLHNVEEAVIPGGGGGKANVAEIRLKSSFKPGQTWNAAALFSPQADWKFAVNYRARSHVKIDDGDATFKQIMTGNAAFDAYVATQLPPNQKAASELRFPSILSLAAAWNPTPDWTWEVDANQTAWSWFKELDVQFSKSPASNLVIPEEYKDSWRVNIGAEHRLPKLTYRFGYYYDQAAAPTESVTPLLPDANRHGATVGMGYKLGKDKAWTLDWYNLALFVENRSTDGKNRDGYDGTYKSFVNSFGMNLGYHW